jgi:hypothetical protein
MLLRPRLPVRVACPPPWDERPGSTPAHPVLVLAMVSGPRVPPLRRARMTQVRWGLPRWFDHQARPTVPGISLRPEPTRQAPGTFDQLTMLELTALSAGLRRGRSRARQAALRARSPLEIWDFVRLSGLLVNLENEAIQALARHYYYYSRGGSPGHGSSSARALRMASSVSCACERWGICRRCKTDKPSSTAQKRIGKSST